MRASLIINAKQIGPYIAEDGLSITRTKRAEKSLTTKDGTLWKKDKEKLSVSVTLLDMSDEQYREISAFFSPNPATVSITDFVTGETFTNRTFYINEMPVQAKKSIGMLTYLTGLSLSLEEK